MDYSIIPSNDVINSTAEAIKKRQMQVIIVNNKEEALEAVKKMIPEGSAVMNGSSTTLNEIGFTDFLKSGNTGWKNLHLEVLNEKDPAKQGYLRRKSLVDADYFLGSMNAITQDGELVAVDKTGSRVGAYPFAANKLLLVVGANKIVPNLDSAFQRIREYVLPQENERAMKAYGMGSTFGKWVIMDFEIDPTRTTVILVKEKLGF